MNKALVIVESPAKAQTINKYLGNNYFVTASYGHVRDLPSSKLAVDVENNFEPTYIIPTKSKRTVTNLKKLAKDADSIYLATDLDREGEAIAWHVAVAISPANSKFEIHNSKFKRITFSEITKEAITEAVSKPRDLNMELVDAQQARRVIDRLVGYNLSPLLWKKVYKGLSAGRVQSVALRLVVEKEREIQGFKPKEYWDIIAKFEKDKIQFETRLVEEAGKKVDKLTVKTQKQAEEIIVKLEKGKYEVLSVDEKTENRYPYAPFTTSTLQQEAGNRLGFSSKQTMRLAQSLYEAGYITYMRTDSVNISSSAVQNIRKFISANFKDALPDAPRVYKTKSKNAQEAHEAIRPADVSLSADKLTGQDERAAKLYDLIWRRAIASQMKEAVLDIIELKVKNADYVFAGRGQSIKFKGWLELYPEKITQMSLPKLSIGEILKLIELKKDQHFTEPPARYSEATLVKALEEKGIGRPSTYAPTISTIQDRGYVIKQSGRLIPEKVGFIVCDILVKNFSNIVDYDFTAQVEEKLDSIAEGKIKWQEVVREIYEPFKKELDAKSDSIEKTDMDEKLEEKCPDCDKNLIIKQTRHGKFIGCTGFPDCRYTRSFVDPKTQEKIDAANEAIKGRKCPKCGSDLKIASGRYGPFIGCSAYPKCKYIERIQK
ncbi:MAG: type I DNA topoisomerase [Candidatus Berkelbacteria bacterium]|nr:type I DNA topoisomerase [Candidatus Berkelbacteria bacterium]